jgi:hypothetical protein
MSILVEVRLVSDESDSRVALPIPDRRPGVIGYEPGQPGTSFLPVINAEHLVHVAMAHE